MSRIGKLRTSPSTDALSLYQERYHDKPRADMHTNLNRQDSVPICLRNQPYDKTPCRSAYGTDPALAPYCYGLCKPRILHQQSLHIGTSFFRPVARITTIITPPEESRPASTRLQHQYASTTPAHVYNASTHLQRQHASTTPASRAKLVVVFTEARAEGR